MTDLLIHDDPNDTGEIPMLGDDPTRNLAEYLMTSPSLDAIPRREAADTEILIPETIGLVGPQSPPPQSPPQPGDPVTERVTLLGALGGEPDRRRSVRYVLPDDRAPWRGPRHLQPAPRWTVWAIRAGTALFVAAAFTLAVIR